MERNNEKPELPRRAIEGDSKALTTSIWIGLGFVVVVILLLMVVVLRG